MLLISRSLLDYHIGSMFFWLLRSELAQISVSTSNQTLSLPRFTPVQLRYALLLEAYCRGNSAQLPSMIKQVDMVNILTRISEKIRLISNKETVNKTLREELFLCKEALQNITSPLNSADQLGELIIEECRVMSSAKQPLLLSWKNPECLASVSTPTHQLIFKNGDDMRQDMLTLQVMRIMDSKWKSQNLDYCLTLYEVLPVGRNIGLIHVVQDWKTLFQIQSTNSDIGASLFNMDVVLLNNHIYKKCSNALSLAGYCIISYILGIKDRKFILFFLLFSWAQADTTFEDRISTVLNRLLDRLDSLENRLDRLENRLDHFENRLDHFENRLDHFENATVTRLDRFENQLDENGNSFDKLMVLIISSVLVSTAAMMCFTFYRTPTWNFGFIILFFFLGASVYCALCFLVYRYLWTATTIPKLNMGNELHLELLTAKIESKVYAFVSTVIFGFIAILVAVLVSQRA